MTATAPDYADPLPRRRNPLARAGRIITTVVLLAVFALGGFDKARVLALLASSVE